MLVPLRSLALLFPSHCRQLRFNFVGPFSGLQIVGEQELGFHLTFEVSYYYFKLHKELLSSFVFILPLKKKVVFLPQFSCIIIRLLFFWHIEEWLYRLFDTVHIFIYSIGNIFNGLSVLNIIVFDLFLVSSFSLLKLHS